ncbi:collagen triple helix repeat-containing protein 1-like [Branchiostoma lanceolatum]|uniref:collagen triple helix repeat-containing protein 1-like n=1 Tax=Branchiostoma lanceolatum TaxID=7740 RepID=UPI00345348DB
MTLYSFFAVVGLVVAMFAEKNHGQDVRMGQCCGSCVSGPQGSPGIPGNNGLPGNPGNPGNNGVPGNNGRDGTKGDRGEQGFPGGDGTKGDRGEQGPPGGDGAKGDRGEQGPPGGDGAKGDRGEQGPPGEKGSAGETGSPGLSARGNIKQCAWNNLNNEADSGKIVECAFNKVSATSVLRLTWSGTIRVTSTSGSCKRWFFTLNESECSDPVPIDGIIYTYGTNININIHRVSTIDGLCFNLPAGPVTVALNVGECASAYPNGDASTGRNSYSRIIVEELNISTGND